MQAIHKLLAPVAELSFDSQHKGPWLSPRKPEPAPTD